MRWLCTVAVLCAACSNGDQNTCTATRDCPTGQECVHSMCVMVDAGFTTTGELGAACRTHDDCKSGLGCLGTADGFSDGVCSRGCAAIACPTKSVCVDLRTTPAGASACMAACTGDGDCRNGYSCCKSLTGASACLPAAMCPATNLGASPDVGMACPAGGACAGGETCQAGAPFPDGACTRACALGNADTCPSNARCVDTETGAWCLASCGGPGDCRPGYDCVPAAAGGSVCRGKAVTCVPGALDDGTPPRACTAGDMPPLVVGNGGQPVGPATPPIGCVKTVQCSALPAGQMQVLGAHAVGEEVAFDVPAGTAGLSVVSQAVGANDTITYMGVDIDNSAVPTLLRAPDGTVVYDDNAAVPGTTDPLPSLSAVFAGGSASTGAFTIPNTSNLLAQTAANGLPSGRWHLTVNDYAVECTLPQFSASCILGASASNRYDVQVLLRPGPLPATGAIDVAFYLVASSGTLTAASAVTDARVARMVQTLSQIYGEAGICLSKVTFYDVPAWAQSKYASGISADRTGPCDELSQMFTLAQPGNTLNFFLVQDITASSSQGGSIVGIDGTIPGPSSLGGTVHSGAAVSLADLSSGTCGGTGIDLAHCGADVVAYIAAHEGGHWLGLFHTSEATGDSFDAVGDTPLCVCDQTCVGASRAQKCGQAGGANPTLVAASDCRQAALQSCQGTDNLMFWQLDQRFSVGNVSPQQGQVMRANPLVK